MRSPLRLIVCLLAAAGASRPGHAADPTPPLPPDDVMEAAGAVVGEIRIEAKDIFDPDVAGEGHRVFRWANAIHPRTREGTIRNLLLFKEGQPYSRRLLEESARVLRAQHYLYDAEVRPIRYDANAVDVLVKTRDVWTLKVGLGLSHAGGANAAHVGLEDANVFGFGKELTFSWEKDIDRTTTLYRYRDPALAGSRVQMSLEYQNASDGTAQSARVARPFYGLDTRWAVGGSVFHGGRIGSTWEAGVAINRFGQDGRTAELSYGWSQGLRDRRVVRTRIGYAYDEERFTPVTSGTPTLFLPPDRRLSYPWIEVEAIRESFVATKDVDKIHRTEDIDVGRVLRARAGWMCPAFGADRTGLYTEAAMHVGTRFARERMALLDGTFTGRFTTQGPQNVIGTLTARFFKRWTERQGTAVDLSGTMARAIDPDQQVLIGGDNGLRGYPLRYESGDRSVLLTVEHRFYGQREYLHLLRLGGAVFVDVGGAWYHATRHPIEDRILRDVGVGLRLGSTRAATAAMLHIDAAVPLDATATMRHVQIVITTKDRF